jgi:hypothetical protein
MADNASTEPVTRTLSEQHNPTNGERRYRYQSEAHSIDVTASVDRHRTAAMLRKLADWLENSPPPSRMVERNDDPWSPQSPPF